MTSRIVFFLALSLVLLTAVAEANPQSRRYLNNALHYYQTGDYEKSKGYFIAVLSIGTAQEKSLAREYLAKHQLKSHTRHRVRPQPVPPVQRPVPETPPNEGLLKLSGYLKEESAFRTSAPSQLSKLRSTGYLAGMGQWTEAVSYKVSGRLWYDAVYDLTNHYPKPVEDDQKTDAQLRDTYVDLSHGNWDARLGKQQIVWGEAVGLFYADVVNAKDLREFVLPDFESIRIPEWGTDFEYTHSDFHAEAIWLPVPEMDKVGRPGSEFAFAVPVPPGFQVQYGPEEKPTQSLENGEVGGRLSYRANGWDLGAFHLRTWDKFPVYTVATAEPGLLTLTATHPRLTIDGVTFAKEVKDVVLKGEVVYNWKKYFQSTDPGSLTGTSAKDYIDYLLGADYVFPNKLDTSLQFSQRIIRDYESDLFGQKAVRSAVTFWLKRAFFDNTLEPEFLVIDDFTTSDVMARPKITYKFVENWRLTLGMDLFSGPSDGLFGEFAAHKRAFAELRFDF